MDDRWIQKPLGSSRAGPWWTAKDRLIGGRFRSAQGCPSRPRRRRFRRSVRGRYQGALELHHRVRRRSYSRPADQNGVPPRSKRERPHRWGRRSSRRRHGVRLPGRAALCILQLHPVQQQPRRAGGEIGRQLVRDRGRALDGGKFLDFQTSAFGRQFPAKNRRHWLLDSVSIRGIERAGPGHPYPVPDTCSDESACPLRQVQRRRMRRSGAGAAQPAEKRQHPAQRR